MDRATETAIKAILLGLHRSKTISSAQLEGVISELAFAARELAGKDADAAADIERLTQWLRDAVAGDPPPQARRSRF
jgi:hypothetical protein